jgi:hypothetical protein
MNFESEGYREFIELFSRHVETYLGDIDLVMHETVSDAVHVDIHVVPANEERPYLALITSGMSDLPMSVPDELDEFKYAELLICLPPDWPISMEAFQDEKNYWPVRWLKILARHPYYAATWFGINHTIPTGEPVCEGLDIAGFMLVPPMVSEVEFFELEVSQDKKVYFYQLLPIYQDEMDLKLEQGADALWEKLEEHLEIEDLINPYRASVCR